MEQVTLSHQETTDLVLSILEGIESAEEGTQLRDSWASEMRDWCELLLARLHEGGTAR